jgi:hypothetical protein
LFIKPFGVDRNKISVLGEIFFEEHSLKLFMIILQVLFFLTNLKKQIKMS